MSIDLLALLQEKVGGALNNFASSQLGESPSMASKAVSQILPALLGKLAGQTGAALVQRIGHTATLYRPARERPQLVLPRP